MNEKHLWERASHDVAEAFTSMELEGICRAQGYRSPVTDEDILAVVEKVKRAVQQDVKTARRQKLVVPGGVHVDCLCYHYALITVAATRAPELARQEAMNAGITILLRCMDNRS